jgi:uncharacterized protein involved in outer membrane biogenesis
MRGNIWLTILFPLVIIFLLLAIFWNWDWFIPFVDARASASLGRQVTVRHLHVGLGRTITVTATGVTIANPSEFPKNEPPLASIDRLIVGVSVLDYIAHGRVSLTRIEVDHPVANIRQLPNGTNNYTLASTPNSNGKPPKLGELIVNNGTAAVIMPRLKTNFSLAIQTHAAPPTAKLFTGGEIVVDAHGTYANAPITAQFIGGALLSLRDPSIPYPVDLHLQNGTTIASLIGTIEDPENFGGARLRLSASGQSMADLNQLTGIPIPPTPPFKLTGDLHYSKSTFRFENFTGLIGSSDLEGTIAEVSDSPRRLVRANLYSHHVDLADLAGFLGGTPGRITTPGLTPAARENIEAANARNNLLPNTKFNLPAINSTNMDLRYHGEHIINRDIPLDNVVAHVTVINGRITADPLNFAVGTGTIASSFDLTPVNGVLHAKANIDFRKVQLSRVMAATHSFAGDGTVGGSAFLTGTGNSVAAILGSANGGASLFLQHGGNISALLVDLTGLQFGDAVLSALGIPRKTPIDCLVSDFGVTNGLMDTKTFLLATKNSNILGSGTVNLSTEELDLALRTKATHVSIGSLSTPIHIGGTLKNPSVAPVPGPLAARAGSAVALGVLFPPLALVPTIRLGLGDKNACEDALTSIAQGHPHNPG